VDSRSITEAEAFSQPLLSEVKEYARVSVQAAMVQEVAFPYRAKKVETIFSSEVFSQSAWIGDTREASSPRERFCRHCGILRADNLIELELESPPQENDNEECGSKLRHRK
jgi:hypothetical protein